MTYGAPYGSLPYGDSPPFPPPPPAPPLEKALFLSSREFDRATISATSAVSSLPATNLQDIDPDKVWRSVGKVGQALTIVLARPIACNALAFTHKLTGAGLARATGALTIDGLASPIVDTGWKSVWPLTGKPNVDDWPSWSSLIRWANENELPVWKTEFADIGVGTTAIEIARLWIDRAFQPSVNVDQNISIGFDSPDAQVRTAYGKTFTDPRGASSRRFTLPFSATNKNDLMEGFFELRRFSGLARDFFVAINPAETTNFHRLSKQALFTDTAQFESQPLWDNSGEVWRQSLTLTEPL